MATLINNRLWYQTPPAKVVFQANWEKDGKWWLSEYSGYVGYDGHRKDILLTDASMKLMIRDFARSDDGTKRFRNYMKIRQISPQVYELVKVDQKRIYPTQVEDRFVKHAVITDKGTKYLFLIESKWIDTFKWRHSPEKEVREWSPFGL